MALVCRIAHIHIAIAIYHSVVIVQVQHAYIAAWSSALPACMHVYIYIAIYIAIAVDQCLFQTCYIEGTSGTSPMQKSSHAHIYILKFSRCVDFEKKHPTRYSYMTSLLYIIYI